MTHEEVSSRVAARFLRAQDEGKGPPPVVQAHDDQGQDGQAGPPAQQAMPQSGPGKANLKRAMDLLNEAFESGDDAGFDEALEGVIKAKGTRT